jgi:hypothetical protein
VRLQPTDDTADDLGFLTRVCPSYDAGEAAGGRVRQTLVELVRVRHGKEQGVDPTQGIDIGG